MRCRHAQVARYNYTVLHDGYIDLESVHALRPTNMLERVFYIELTFALSHVTSSDNILL